MASADVVRNRATARREREREIVAATRNLFDERGLQDAPIEEIANAVGINKALIYRHFASKDELFVATMVEYLSELRHIMAGVEVADPPLERLREVWTRFIDFGLRYPAFLDCSLSLMRRPAHELEEAVSDAVWLRLGQGMGALLGALSALLADGAREGVFDVVDPDFTANQLYAQTLGALHLARVGVGVRQSAEGVPQMFEISHQAVREACLAATLATVAHDAAA
jgi:AcrR family transcriptional regulator